jgi:hypothetical protein
LMAATNRLAPPAISTVVRVDPGRYCAC